MRRGKCSGGANRGDLLRDPNLSRSQRTIDRWFGAVQAAVGTPERIVEIVEAYRDEGCDYLILNFPEAATDPDAMALFATEVMPSFR